MKNLIIPIILCYCSIFAKLETPAMPLLNETNEHVWIYSFLDGELDLFNEDGSKLLCLDVQAGKIKVPTNELEPGKYTIVLKDQSNKVIDRISIEK